MNEENLSTSSLTPPRMLTLFRRGQSVTDPLIVMMPSPERLGHMTRTMTPRHVAEDLLGEHGPDCIRLMFTADDTETLSTCNHVTANAKIVINLLRQNDFPPPGTSHDPSQPGTSHDPSQPGTSHDPSQPGTSHDPSQPGTSHDPSQPGTSHDPSQPGTSHDPSQPGTSHDPSQPGTSHDPSQPGTSHDPSQPGTSHDPSQPGTSHDPRDGRVQASLSMANFAQPCATSCTPHKGLVHGLLPTTPASSWSTTANTPAQVPSAISASNSATIIYASRSNSNESIDTINYASRSNSNESIDTLSTDGSNSVISIHSSSIISLSSNSTISLSSSSSDDSFHGAGFALNFDAADDNAVDNAAHFNNQHNQLHVQAAGFHNMDIFYDPWAPLPAQARGDEEVDEMLRYDYMTMTLRTWQAREERLCRVAQVKSDTEVNNKGGWRRGRGKEK